MNDEMEDDKHHAPHRKTMPHPNHQVPHLNE
jgi:hypothetical protein